MSVDSLELLHVGIELLLYNVLRTQIKMCCAVQRVFGDIHPYVVISCQLVIEVSYRPVSSIGNTLD